MDRIIDRPLKVDFHTHCNYSPDSQVTMEEMIEKSIEIGITDLAFTDHVDLDADMGTIEDGTIQSWDFDRDDFEKIIHKNQEIYKGKINIYQGLEVGVQPHLAKENAKIVKANAYDFVIASVHSVEKKDLYYKRFFENYSDSKAVQLYYESLYESIEDFKDYSVIGHLDLYLRYKNALKQVAFSEYYDIVSAVYKRIIEDGKGLELNAGGHRYGLGHNNPNEYLLKLYKEMNGEILTLGSDAHSTQYLGHHYGQNIDLLKSLGFKYICTFEQMKPVFHKI